MRNSTINNSATNRKNGTTDVANDQTSLYPQLWDLHWFALLSGLLLLWNHHHISYHVANDSLSMQVLRRSSSLPAAWLPLICYCTCLYILRINQGRLLFLG